MYFQPALTDTMMFTTTKTILRNVLKQSTQVISPPIVYCRACNKPENRSTDNVKRLSLYVL